jgi:hypothetical protein
MKLEAKDLRIGNYVQVYLEPQISEWICHERFAAWRSSHLHKFNY